MTSPTLREVLAHMLREQTDQTNVIETCWQLFAGYVKIPPGGVQWVESRRCFFAGALTLFEAVMTILEPGAEPTDADVARLDRIVQELQRHNEDVLAGRA